MERQHIDLIAKHGYSLVDFKKDCQQIFGKGTGTVMIHFASQNRAPILYFWNGNVAQRVWDRKPMDGTIKEEQNDG